MQMTCRNKVVLRRRQAEATDNKGQYSTSTAGAASGSAIYSSVSMILLDRQALRSQCCFTARLP